MYKINLNEPWASITYEFGLMITPFYIHKKSHQFIINVSIIPHPYPSSLQIKQQLKFIMYGVSRYYADVKKTIIFSSNFLTFVISFLGTHSYFLLTISNIT